MTMVTIKDESGNGRIAASITLETGAERITLRDLITTRVREEVARYNARQADPGPAGDIFAGLVMPEGAVPTPSGFRMPSRRPVGWEQQAAESLKAFRRNRFFVLVGGRQVTGLDEELELTADCDIRFIRLVALVGAEPVSETTDDAAAPLAAAQHAFDTARAEAWERAHASVTRSQTRALPEVKAILNASADLRRQCCILASLDERTSDQLLSVIVRETDGLTAEDLATFLPAMAVAASRLYGLADPGLKAQTGLVEDAWGRLDEEGRERLAPEVARVALAAAEHMPDVMTRLRRLLDTGRVPYNLIFEADNVGTALRAVIAAGREPDAVRGALIRLLAEFPTAGKPGGQWIAAARDVAGQFSDSPGLVGVLLDAAIDAEDFETERRYVGRCLTYVTKANEPIVCGLAVLAGQVAGTGAADLLPRLRTLALKAITMIGPFSESRSIRVATSCVSAIEDAALPASITELLRTERSTRHGTLLRQARTSVDALAAAQGMARDELLERSVEDHGLAADGTRRVTLAAGWTAVLSAGARTAAVEYAGPDGKPRKSPPAQVKQASAGALGTLAADLKAVRATIGNERSRIEGLLGSGRSLGLALWRELYLDHPVTGRLARALIWTFTSPGGAPVAGIPVGELELLLCDAATAAIPANAEVTL